MTHKSIQALEWVPRVPYANRPAYEAQARSDGYIGFGFNELDRRSQAVSAGVRAEYFPVYYVGAVQRKRTGPGLRSRVSGYQEESHR